MDKSYDELVKRLRLNAGDKSKSAMQHDCEAAADAITKLRAERDSHQRVCMTVMAERDALAALLKSLSGEVQRTWYNADSYAESQRGLTCIKRKIDATLAAAEGSDGLR